MLDVLEFIFQDFLHYIGMLILIAITVLSIPSPVKIIKNTISKDKENI